MPGAFTQNYLPQFAGGGFQAAGQTIGLFFIDRLHRQLPRRQTQLGDSYMDGARLLLQKNLILIDEKDKPLIRFAYESSVFIPLLTLHFFLLAI